MKKALYIGRVLLFMTAIPVMIASVVWANKLSRRYTLQDRVYTNLSNKLRFVESGDLDTLLTHYQLTAKQTPVRSFNWHELKTGLNSQEWVDSANVYLDANNDLHIVYRQREPHVRIVETDNPEGGYYLDEEANRILLSDKFLVRVPVATMPLLKQNNIDKQVLLDVVKISDAILLDSFWRAACTQLDIRSNGEIQLIPAMGQQVIRLGNADQIENKLARLTLFYQQGYKTIRWSLYDEIDARFAGQIVGRNTHGKVLSIDPYDPKANKLLADSNQTKTPLKKLN